MDIKVEGRHAPKNHGALRRSTGPLTLALHIPSRAMEKPCPSGARRQDGPRWAPVRSSQRSGNRIREKIRDERFQIYARAARSPPVITERPRDHHRQLKSDGKRQDRLGVGCRRARRPPGRPRRAHSPARPRDGPRVVRSTTAKSARPDGFRGALLFRGTPSLPGPRPAGCTSVARFPNETPSVVSPTSSKEGRT